MADEKYSLTRGSDQIVRVNLIQYTWRETLGFLLHPAIPQKDISHIADVATATGLWLCTVSNAYPDVATLDGFDISPRGFLPQRDLPAKVTLQAANATEPVPDNLKGKYDLVHVRLLQPGIHEEAMVPKVLAHCMDLLRPGGYIQWEEFDVKSIDSHVPDDVPRPSHLEYVTGVVANWAPKDWIARLPQIMESHGLSVKACERKREPSWHRTTISVMNCRVVNEMSYAAVDATGPPGAGDALRARIKAALEEVDKGSYLSFMFQCVVAQKPA